MMKIKIFLIILVILVALVLSFYYCPKKSVLVNEANIKVLIPRSFDEIGLPLLIRGEARIFENTLNFRLKDDNGSVLIENITNAKSPDIGQFGPFEVSVSYKAPETKTGVLEVFDYSAKDGSEIDKVIIPVNFRQIDSSSVKVFFGNNISDPNIMDCSKLYSVERRISKMQALARVAIEELLKGPTIDEGRQGFFTSINSGVNVNKLTINGGIARIDFNEMLELNVGGSCRVFAIRAQITDTLRQFSSVKEVIISINGKIEEILQP